MPKTKDDLAIKPDQKPSTKPKQIGLVAKLTSDNIRYFWIILMLGLISCISILSAWSSSKRADHNIKVAWVKMYPNGTWDVEFHDESRGPEFFQSTIDYILRNWTIRRFSEIPASIKSDYGYAYVFMSPKLRNRFMSKGEGGFNAADKAAQIADSTAYREVRIQYRNMDHYDSDKTTFGKYQGTLYRTHVFINKITHNTDGSPLPDPQKMIVSIQWRILSKEEIQADKEIIEQNPIGLEIVEYDLLQDLS